jgi:hypothetical protein
VYIDVYSLISTGTSDIEHIFGIPVFSIKNKELAGHWWLTPVILGTLEAEIKRVMVQSHPGQIVCETLS